MVTACGHPPGEVLVVALQYTGRAGNNEVFAFRILRNECAADYALG